MDMFQLCLQQQAAAPQSNQEMMTMMMGGLMQGMIKQSNNEDVNGTPQKKMCSGDGKNCNALIPHSAA